MALQKVIHILCDARRIGSVLSYTLPKGKEEVCTVLVLEKQVNLINENIYSISIQAFSPIDTASASLEVSTEVTGVWGLIVLLKNISAFFSSCPSSPKTSRAESKENELS